MAAIATVTTGRTCDAQLLDIQLITIVEGYNDGLAHHHVPQAHHEVSQLRIIKTPRQLLFHHAGQVIQPLVAARFALGNRILHIASSLSGLLFSYDLCQPQDGICPPAASYCQLTHPARQADM